MKGTAVKKIIIAGALLLGCAGVASAAGAEPTSGNQSPYDWSGSYIGLHLGYGWGDSTFVDNEYNGVGTFPEVKWGVKSDGLIGGLNGGHNWHRDDFVYGIEGEVGHLNLSGNRLQPGVDPLGDPYDGFGTVGKGWYGGLSARAGYALDRTLLYAKAGVVYSAAKLGFSDTCTVAPCGNSTANASEKVGWGYQLGAGLDYALTDRWIVKAEYAYMDFGKSKISGQGVGGGFAGVPFSIRSDLSIHTLKLGVNYKF